jgi:hypothetical protein
MSAQQFVSCGVERDISRDRTGVREPMLNTSAAINNRAASFIGHNLSPTRTFQRRFSICLFFAKLNAQAKIAHFLTKQIQRSFAMPEWILSKFFARF